MANLTVLLLLLLPVGDVAFRWHPLAGYLQRLSLGSTRNKIPIAQCAGDAAEFDIELAQRLAAFCEASYRNLKPGQSTLFGADLVEQRELLNGAGYFIASAPTAVYVVFRGTANVENIMSDLNAVLVEMPWLASEESDGTVVGKGHAGFVTLYLSIRQLVWDTTLQAHEANDQANVFITGHSLGGALATLFAADLAMHQAQLVPKLRVYTFGSPRVGDTTFAAAFNRHVSHSFRCRNKLDIVTRLPLWSIMYKYKHVAKEVVFFTSTDSTDAEDVPVEWEVEPPKFLELSPKELVKKFMAYPHLEQLDLQNHLIYLNSNFPKNPFGSVALRAEMNALKAEVEALKNQNEFLTSENERLIAENEELKAQIDE